MTIKKLKKHFLCLIICLTAISLNIMAGHVSAGDERDARWTMIMMLAGEYADMEETLELEGAGDDVDVVVLHDPYGVGNSHAYYLPVGPGPAVDIPLDEIFYPDPGDEISIRNKWVVDDFLNYVQTNFPSQHYLLSIRSGMDFYSFLEDIDYPANDFNMYEEPACGEKDDRYTGITIVDFAWVMDRFVQRNGGEKLDVLNLGLCLSSVADWVYEMVDYADYFSGSETYTNPPVAAYWRNYRWLYEMKNNPAITPEELVIRIAEIFASHAYYGYKTDEPFQVSSIDLSLMPDVATKFSLVIDRLLELFPSQADEFVEAVSISERFGQYRRCDMTHLLENTLRYISDTQLEMKINDAVNSIDAAVIANEYEHFRNCCGLMVPLLTFSDWHGSAGDLYLERCGSFAEEVGMENLMDALPPPEPPVEGLIITEVDPHPNDEAGTEGDVMEIYNYEDESVDLRGLIIDDLDGPRRYSFIDEHDVNHNQAILAPGEFAVVRFRRTEANPYVAPADAEVTVTGYGLEITSYTVHEYREFSDHDDQAVLIDGDVILDAVAWCNRDGESNGIEAVNLERLVEYDGWDAPEDVAEHYFRENYAEGNQYEKNTVNFSFIAGGESGSLQRKYDGSFFSQGLQGIDSPDHFTVLNDTTFGDFTPVDAEFQPQACPHLMITELAPNISITENAGDLIEIYNAGLQQADIYYVILSDIDPGENEEDLPGSEIEIVGDDIGPGIVMLNPGEMIVVELISDSVQTQPDPVVTDYGFYVKTPAGQQFDARGDQTVLVNRNGGDLIDSFAYINTDLAEFDNDAAKRDYLFDFDALTLSEGGFGFVLDNTDAWAGDDDMSGMPLTDAFDYRINQAVTFPFAENEGGSIQRNISGYQFQEGLPDSKNIFFTSNVTSFGVLPSWTQTPSPTGTLPTYTPTRTPTPTFSFSATPTNTPTFTPTMEHSFTPPPSPTQPHTGIECAILTNQEIYEADDLFLLDAEYFNHHNYSVTAAEMIVLDVYQEYWFWPDWTQNFNFRSVNMPPNHYETENILSFVWPPNAGQADDLKFWIAFMDTDFIELHCFHNTAFGFR